MEQLPTKEQILEKRVKINDANIDYIRNHPERRINGTLRETICEAMEEYAAVKTMPLVEVLKEIRDHIREIQALAKPDFHYVNFDYVDKIWWDNRHINRIEKIDSLLSTYTGDQPKPGNVECQVCGKLYHGEEPKGCCSGRDCGCMGQPINGPFICSKECYDKYRIGGQPEMSKFEKAIASVAEPKTAEELFPYVENEYNDLAIREYNQRMYDKRAAYNLGLQANRAEQLAQQSAAHFSENQYEVLLDNIGRIFKEAQDTLSGDDLDVLKVLECLQELRNIACEYLQLLSKPPKVGEQPAQQAAVVSPDSDALASPPNFDQLVAMIEKLFRDYLTDVMKEPAKGIDKAWERYKILNHLYRDGTVEEPLKSEG